MKKNRMVSSMASYSCLVTLLFPLFIMNSFLLASNDNKILDKNTNKSSLPHCGLYCIYTLLRAWDVKVDFKDLVRPSYISHSKGSSLHELKLAATDNHLYAECIGNLTVRSLKSYNTRL